MNHMNHMIMSAVLSSLFSTRFSLKKNCTPFALLGTPDGWKAEPS